ncbi:hypothetical protein J1N35_008940 [Gossypium stocksii]|uniref:Uncharacterized protein n=1 Tax=Gossypium stocksii TaxID=47602 RepID=A0A9D3WAF4_9ROSI|nr:hypothetical protein J1N35_008940 [Gossypium stocksii]
MDSIKGVILESEADNAEASKSGTGNILEGSGRSNSFKQYFFMYRTFRARLFILPIAIIKKGQSVVFEILMEGEWRVSYWSSCELGYGL